MLFHSTRLYSLIAPQARAHEWLGPASVGAMIGEMGRRPVRRACEPKKLNSRIFQRRHSSALGSTFPFNLMVGILLYIALAQMISR